MSQLPEGFCLAGLAAAVEERVADWRSTGRLARLRRGDRDLWPRSQEPDRLGWLKLPAQPPEQTRPWSAFAKEIRSAGIERILLLGMGGSSLGPEVFQSLLGGRAGWPRLVVVDSTHPDSVARATKDASLGESLVVVSSKSGSTIETLSLLRFFRRELGKGGRFVAITDPGSPLEELARQDGFLRVFRSPPDIGGRFSALSVFGLLPAALIGIEPAMLLGAAARPAARFAREEYEAPAPVLGALLAEGARCGRDKLTFVAAPGWESLSDWLEQLVAESLGKSGVGVVPITREPLGAIAAYGDDRVFVALGPDRGDPLLSEFLEAARRGGHPVVERRFTEPQEVAAEMFDWQLAVALAAADLGVYPFDQPDVELAKHHARRAMEGRGSRSSEEVVGIDASALDKELRSWLERPGAGDTIFLQAFLDPDENVARELRLLQGGLRDHTGLAVAAAFGPRFLHSTGQLHKGGPSRAVFLQLTDRPSEDLEIPGAGFSFSRLISAQADGDAAALAERGRRVLRLDLGPDAVAGLARVREALAR